MEKGYNIPTFDESTELKDVMEAYGKRKEVYNKLKLKVGVVKAEKLNSRYCSTDRYKCLDKSSIFGRCKYSVALKIESMLMKILEEDGTCMNSTNDKQSLRAGDDDCDAFVYVTELKEDLFYCPISKCGFVSELQHVKEHAKSHEYFVMMTKHILVLRSRGVEVPQSIIDSLAPIPYKHRAWRSNNCESCGMNFNSGAELASHRATCKHNKVSGFACLEPGCNHKSASLDDFDKHKRKHAFDAGLVDREGSYVCKVCGKKFKVNTEWRRHEHIHEPPKHKCPHCGQLFSRKDGKDRHMKKFAPGSKQCPSVNLNES